MFLASIIESLSQGKTFEKTCLRRGYGTDSQMLSKRVEAPEAQNLTS
jgi:hypothetical protein